MDNDTSKKEMNRYVQELRAKGCKNAVLQLVAGDFEYGLGREQIKRYAEKNWKIERMEQFSKALRMTDNDDFLSMLENGNFGAEQMEVLIRFMGKGLPAQQIESVANRDMKPHAMQKALQKVYEAAEQAKKVAEKEPVFIKEVQERIDAMVDGIGDNKDFLLKVMDKLGSIDQLQQSNDDVRESLAKTIDQKDRELEEQQRSNNKLAVECAELRTKYSTLKESQENFEREKAAFEQEKEGIVRERNQLSEENKRLGKEKEELEKRISELTEQLSEAEKPVTGQTMGNTEDQDSSEKADYFASVKGSGQMLHVERTVARRPERLMALAGKKIFKGKSRINLIKELTGKGLNPEQMEQIKVAIQSGLNEQEVIDIINSGFSAKEMAQAIEIVVADRMYQ